MLTAPTPLAQYTTNMSPDGVGSTPGTINAVPSTATGVKTEPTKVPTSFKHPLDPLTSDEVSNSPLAQRTYEMTSPNIDRSCVLCSQTSRRIQN